MIVQVNPKELEKSFLHIEKSIATLDEQKQYKVMLITEEILTNLVRHADFQTLNSDITVSVEISKEQNVLFTCRDNSKEFNLLKHPDPDVTASIENRKLGGLGIYLSKKYAKTLDYSYENGYNILKITL